MVTEHALEIWTIYDHPKDYPDGYVIRCWRIGRDGSQHAMEGYGRATLEEARAMVPQGLFCIPADKDLDDPTVLESWL